MREFHLTTKRKLLRLKASLRRWKLGSWKTIVCWMRSFVLWMTAMTMRKKKVPEEYEKLGYKDCTSAGRWIAQGRGSSHHLQRQIRADVEEAG